MLKFKEVLAQAPVSSTEKQLLVDLFAAELEGKKFKSPAKLRVELHASLKRKMRAAGQLEEVYKDFYWTWLDNNDDWKMIIVVSGKCKELITKLISLYSEEIPGLAEMPTDQIIQECISWLKNQIEANGYKPEDYMILDYHEKHVKSKDPDGQPFRVDPELRWEEKRQRRRDSWL